MRIKSSDEISNQHYYFFGSTKNCLAFSEMNTYLLNFNCQGGNLKICQYSDYTQTKLPIIKIYSYSKYICRDFLQPIAKLCVQDSRQFEKRSDDEMSPLRRSRLHVILDGVLEVDFLFHPTRHSLRHLNHNKLFNFALLCLWNVQIQYQFWCWLS